MTPVPDYRLVPVLRLLQQNRIRLLLFTMAAILGSLGGYFLFRPGYKAEVVFVLTNPLYADRGNVYGDARSTSYFAGGDDISRFIAMASSDTLQQAIIRKYALAEVYHCDTSRPEDIQELRKKLNKSLHIYLEENNEVVLAFTDKNATRAAAIANDYVSLTEQSYRSFYNEMRNNMSGALAAKIGEQDSIITSMTDTLSILREQYGIYDIISPSRSNLILSARQPNGRKGYAKGLELVQNMESVKDEFVADRSRNLTLLHQYTTGNRIQQQNLVRIARAARTPVSRSGVGLFSILVLAGFAGFMTGVCYTIARTSFSTANQGHVGT